MEHPSITLVTPSFNQARFVEQTLRSVLSQGYPKLEYIVTDGGSTDGSAEIIRRYEDQLAWWDTTPDDGQAAAINRGFARSSGEIMGWLNSDDLLLPGALALVGEIFARFPQVAWISGWGLHASTEGYLTSFTPPTARLRSLIARGWYHGRGLGFIQQESTFWRRRLWEASGGYVDESRHYSLDFELWQRFARHAALVTVRGLVGVFRRHPAQKSGQAQRYYEEIGVRLPHAARLITVPGRALFSLALWPAVPRIVYSRRAGGWVFHPGLRFRPGVF